MYDYSRQMNISIRWNYRYIINILKVCIAFSSVDQQIFVSSDTFMWPVLSWSNYKLHWNPLKLEYVKYLFLCLQVFQVKHFQVKAFLLTSACWTDCRYSLNLHHLKPLTSWSNCPSTKALNLVRILQNASACLNSTFKDYSNVWKWI